VATTFHSSVSAFQENVAHTRKSLTHNANAFVDNSNTRATSVRGFESHSSEVVGVLKKKVLKHDLLEDIPTSETPKKRDYPIPSAWQLTKPHEEILGQLNKMPLGNVDINLTTQTPGPMTRVQNVMVENVGSVENSFEKKLISPPFEKSAVVEKITPEGRENTVFKSKLAPPSSRRRGMAN
jgi:hypothetical protein